MADPQSKPPEKNDELVATYDSLVKRGDFPFGEPKNQGSSVGAFINTVKRVASNFNSQSVFVRPKSK